MTRASKTRFRAVAKLFSATRAAIVCSALLAVAIQFALPDLGLAQTDQGNPPPTGGTKTCPACQKLAQQLAETDDQIAHLQREEASLRQNANLNDPNIQRVLREDDAKIAQLQTQRSQLVQQKAACEKTCAVSPPAATPQPTPPQQPPPQQPAPPAPQTTPPPQPAPPAVTPAPAPPATGFKCRTPEVEAKIKDLRRTVNNYENLLYKAMDAAEAAERFAEQKQQERRDGGHVSANDVEELFGKAQKARDKAAPLSKKLEDYRNQLAALEALPPCPDTPAAAPQPPVPQQPPAPQPPPPPLPKDQLMQAPLLFPPPNGLYVRFGAGATFLPNTDLTTRFRDGSTTEITRSVPGFDLGTAFGGQWGPLRVEGEVAFRSNPATTLKSTTEARIGGDTQAVSFLTNVVYDFPLSPGWAPVTPHLGAGIGVAQVSTDQRVNGITVFSSADTQFAYQLIAGLRYQLAGGWSADLDYRYFGTPGVDYHDLAHNRVTSSYNTHNIVLSLTYSFWPPPPPP